MSSETRLPSLEVFFWIVTALTATAVLSVVLVPSWPAVVVSAFCVALLGYLLWVDPINRKRVTHEDVASLIERLGKCEQQNVETQAQLNALRMKLGFVQR